MVIVEELKTIFGKSLEKFPHFVTTLGLATIGISFATYEKVIRFPTFCPNWIIFSVGGMLIIIGVVLYIVSGKSNKTLKYKTTIKFYSTILTIKIGNLQDEKDLENNCVFILPANTSFADDCVTDKNSALGAFFNKHHSDKIPQFNQKIKTILAEKKIQPTESVHYAPATVLMLPDEFSIKAKIILVASSKRNEGEGFYTDPAIISDSIQNIFKETSDKRISTFLFPIIGSGHAGLEITNALNLLILCIKHHSKKFNHIRNVIIFVRECDRQKINANFLNSL